MIIIAGEKPNDMISCELSIAESTSLMELKWRKHRQSTGSLRALAGGLQLLWEMYYIMVFIKSVISTHSVLQKF